MKYSELCKIIEDNVDVTKSEKENTNLIMAEAMRYAKGRLNPEIISQLIFWIYNFSKT